METLQLLGVALGMASLCGINLYLTVFATGLAIRFEWIALSEQYAQLSVLADPVILAVSGIFFFFEFFADKIPWVDSVWDSVHTLIRPVGAAFVSITVLGDPNPVFDVVVGLLGGGAALTTHAVKSTGRLVINSSPEPLSNIAASFAEDGAVIGGLALLAWNPLIGLAIVVLGLALAWFLAPKIFRLLRSRLFFAWKKLTAPAEQDAAEPPKYVPVDLDCSLHQRCDGPVRVAWSVPATAAKVPGVPANARGHLVAVEKGDGGPADLFWGGRAGFRPRLANIPHENWKHEYRRGMLYDRATIYEPGRGKRVVLLFDRTARPHAEKALDRLFCAAGNREAA